MTMTESPLRLAAVVMATLILLATGCGTRQRENNLFWSPVTEESDAVMERLDMSLRGDFDSALINTGVRRLAHIADSLRAEGDSVRSRKLESRILYWNAQVQFMTGSDSVMKTLIDSAARLASRDGSPYDRARIAEIQSQTIPHDTTRARIYGECLQEYKCAGDSFRMVVMYNRIGIMMSATQNLREARTYYRKARALTRPGTRQDFINSFNLFINILDTEREGIATRDDSLELQEMTRILKNNALFATRPPKIRMQIYKSLYDSDGNVQWLDSARDLAAGTWVPTAYAWLGNHALRTGDTKSARKYADLVLFELNSKYGPDAPIAYYDDVSAFLRDYFRSIGDKAAAERYQALNIQFTRMSREYVNNMVSMANTFKQNELKMAHIEFGQEASRRQELAWLRITITVIIAGAIVATAAVILRRRRRKNAVASESDRNTERQLADKLLHEMSTGNADQDWSKFSVLFSNAHPGFITALTSRYPDLTNGDIRMACYILAGMDTKQIARVLSINPSSVTKNRHRLRAKLGLTPDQDTAAFLRAIV